MCRQDSKTVYSNDFTEIILEKKRQMGFSYTETLPYIFAVSFSWLNNSVCVILWHIYMYNFCCKSAVASHHNMRKFITSITSQTRAEIQTVIFSVCGGNATETGCVS